MEARWYERKWTMVKREKWCKAQRICVMKVSTIYFPSPSSSSFTYLTTCKMLQWNDTREYGGKKMHRRVKEKSTRDEKRERKRKKPDESSENNNAITYIISSWNFQYSARERSSAKKVDWIGKFNWNERDNAFQWQAKTKSQSPQCTRCVPLFGKTISHTYTHAPSTTLPMRCEFVCLSQ